MTRWRAPYVWAAGFALLAITLSIALAWGAGTQTPLALWRGLTAGDPVALLVVPVGVVGWPVGAVASSTANMLKVIVVPGAEAEVNPMLLGPPS